VEDEPKMGKAITRRTAAAWRTVRWASRGLLVGLIGAVLAASATPALGQDDERAVKNVIELNRKALVSVDARQFDAARDLLLQAVTVAKQANLLTHKMLARTYVHLGAVSFLGFDDRKTALRYFGLAKGIRADIKLTPSLATPNLTAVFDKSSSADGREADVSGDTPKPSPRPPRRVLPPVAQPGEPAPAAPPPPVATGGEPQLPVVLPADLYCPAVEEASEGQEIVLRCAAKPSVKAERVLLYFRASGAPSYSVAAMQNSPSGWLVASIPVEAATGESLQYYCEARDSADNVVATSGQEDIPNPIILRPALAGATTVQPGVVAGGKGDGEDPLKRIKDEQDTEVLESAIHRRRRGAFWVGVGAGTGWGYHPKSLMEYRRDAVPVKAGVRIAGLITFYPEIGYLITDHLGIAVQGRVEYFPKEGSGETNAGGPATGAVAVLGRGLYYLDLGPGNAQIQFSADFGGGNGYRFAFPPTNPDHKRNLGTNPDGTCISRGGVCIPAPTLVTDTVRSGPIVYGAGVGFIYHVNKNLAGNFEVRFLGAGPRLGLLGEFYASLQFALGGKRPAQAGDAPPMERMPEDDEEE
jgi:hypothetical protein